MSGDDMRRELRIKRNKLTSLEQQYSADVLARLISDEQLLNNVKNIGIYLENDGEIGTSHIINMALESNVSCFLPVLDFTAHSPSFL